MLAASPTSSRPLAAASEGSARYAARSRGRASSAVLAVIKQHWEPPAGSAGGEGLLLTGHDTRLPARRPHAGCRQPQGATSWRISPLSASHAGTAVTPAPMQLPTAPFTWFGCGRLQHWLQHAPPVQPEEAAHSGLGATPIHSAPQHGCLLLPPTSCLQALHLLARVIPAGEQEGCSNWWGKSCGQTSAVHCDGVWPAVPAVAAVEVAAVHSACQVQVVPCRPAADATHHPKFLPITCHRRSCQLTGNVERAMLKCDIPRWWSPSLGSSAAAAAVQAVPCSSASTARRSCTQTGVVACQERQG